MNGRWKILESFCLIGVPLSAGSCRKAQLIQKVVYAEILELPVLPSKMERVTEISKSRVAKLTVDGVKIPFPEQLSSQWFSGSQYFPSLTVDVISQYAEKTCSMKGFREGKNLLFSGHVNSVLFHRITDTIKFCFIKAKVVPQTRILEEPYSVWVCLRNDCSFIKTAECACVAGYSQSCKHVFALLHYIENEVKLGLNTSCTSRKQQWSAKVAKKGDKIHTPCELSTVNFARPHPEHDDGYSRPVRILYEPRSLGDLDAIFTQDDWEAVAEASDGTASVFQFRQTKAQTTVKPVHKSKPRAIPDIAATSNINEFHADLKLSRTSKDIMEISEVTLKQATSDEWFQYRIGMITASTAHEGVAKS